MKINVSVHPNSKAPKIIKDDFGKLNIYVNQQAIDGKANKAVIKTLAKHLKVKESNIFLDRGAKSKNKVFEILQLK